MDAIYLEEKHKKIVKDILQKYDYNFFAFGSRVKGNCRKFSDLDLFYTQDLPLSVLLSVEEDFEDSDLPFKVDLINYKTCDKDFQCLMLQNYVCIQ
jgi:predicted nucleotidyltransferase